MIRLYIETNFLVSYVREQHPDYEELLGLIDGNVDLRIPQVAIMELFKTVERLSAARQATIDSLIERVRDLVDGRRHQSEATRSLVSACNGAIQALNEERRRLQERAFKVARMVSELGGTIPLPSWPPEAVTDLLAKKAPDDMILVSIIGDVIRDKPNESAWFLTEDHDFNDRTARAALEDVAVAVVAEPVEMIRMINGIA